MAFSGVLCTLLMVHYDIPLLMAIFITMMAGFSIGCLNGLAYTKFNISPLIVTLAMQSILRGAAFLITNGTPIYGISASLRFLGQGHVMDIVPFPIIVMVIAFGFGYWLLEYTYMGNYIYAVGGNQEAARLSGINNKVVSILAFAASALFVPRILIALQPLPGGTTVFVCTM